MISEKEYKDIVFNIESGVCTITLNRPDQLNALRYPLLMEILDVLESVRNNELIRVIVFKGAGRGFCSGDDLKNMGVFPTLEGGYLIPHHKVFHLIRQIEKPVIALLHGYCLGAGFELTLACDFRLAADNLIMGDHRTSRAICVLSGASWFLPRLIGLARATEIIFTGRHLDANEALEIGLVNKVYPISEFKEKSHEFIEEIARMPTRCLGYNKTMINFSIFNDLFTSLQHELKLFNENLGTDDFKEGLSSFLEKRDPKFKGK
ncbi:MAG: enoyl-CoA hydratase/isomerase family protein [Promethearchaeota archaeon]|jgi:2-(1,2-epoxy-1,2-dihydrophenyl)acetyl-CoA isomerase